jgi:hypothetical protein
MRKLIAVVVYALVSVPIGGCVIMYKGIDMENGVPKKPRPLSAPTLSPAPAQKK